MTTGRRLPSMAATTPGSGTMRHGRNVPMACAGVLACLLAACASTSKEMSALDRAQYDWSAAIRWAVEGAWRWSTRRSAKRTMTDLTSSATAVQVRTTDARAATEALRDRGRRSTATRPNAACAIPGVAGPRGRPVNVSGLPTLTGVALTAGCGPPGMAAAATIPSPPDPIRRGLPELLACGPPPDVADLRRPQRIILNDLRSVQGRAPVRGQRWSIARTRWWRTCARSPTDAPHPG